MVYGYSFELYWLQVFYYLAAMIVFILGISYITSAVVIFFKDVGQLVTMVLQFWFWLTPIVYTPSIIPEKYHALLMLNPMTSIIMGYHNVLVYDKAPDINLLLYPAIVSIVAMTLALVMFKKANEEMADVL